jgi:hypothetical protein
MSDANSWRQQSKGLGFVRGGRKVKGDAGRGKIADRQAVDLPTHLAGESLNHDEWILLFLVHVHPAGMTVEIPATGSDFTGGHRPRSVAVREEACPGTAGTSKSLHKSQRAKNGNHPAFLNLDQRQQGSPLNLH